MLKFIFAMYSRKSFAFFCSSAMVLKLSAMTSNASERPRSMISPLGGLFAAFLADFVFFFGGASSSLSDMTVFDDRGVCFAAPTMHLILAAWQLLHDVCFLDVISGHRQGIPFFRQLLQATAPVRLRLSPASATSSASLSPRSSEFVSLALPALASRNFSSRSFSFFLSASLAFFACMFCLIIFNASSFSALSSFLFLSASASASRFFFSASAFFNLSSSAFCNLSCSSAFLRSSSLRRSFSSFFLLIFSIFAWSTRSFSLSDEDSLPDIAVVVQEVFQTQTNFNIT